MRKNSLPTHALPLRLQGRLTSRADLKVGNYTKLKIAAASPRND